MNPLGYSCIKKLQRDNLWHAYNEPINIYSVVLVTHTPFWTEKIQHIYETYATDKCKITQTLTAR